MTMDSQTIYEIRMISHMKYDNGLEESKIFTKIKMKIKKS